MDGLQNTDHILDTNMGLAASAQYVLALDANADTRVREFFIWAGRYPVFLDTPACTPFAGTTVKVQTHLDTKTYKVSSEATLVAVVDAILAHTGSVAVGCTWARDVKALKQLLEEYKSRFEVLICYGDEDQAYNTKFINEFRKPTPPRKKTVFIYSPKISEGISNTTCTLALYLARCGGYGPNVQKMVQAMMRARCARKRVVYVLDNDTIYSRVPNAVVSPDRVLTPVPCNVAVWPGGDKVTACIQATRFHEMNRLVFGSTQPVSYNTLDTMLVQSANHTALRVHLAEPRSSPSNRETEDDCIRLRSAAMAIASQLAGLDVGFGACLATARSLVFDDPTARTQLRLSVATEAKNRANNFLPFLGKTCKRMGMEFSKELVLVSAADAKRAREQVQKAFIIFNADIIIAEIKFYVGHVKGMEAREETLFVNDMTTLCATYRDGRGDSAVVNYSDAQLKELFDEDEIVEMRNFDDYWSTYVVKRFLAVHDKDATADDSTPPVPKYSVEHHLYVKMWMATRAFTERNFVMKIDDICKVLGAYLAEPAAAKMRDTLRAIGTYTRLFNELWQERFVACAHFYEKLNENGVDPMLAEARRMFLGSGDERSIGEGLLRNYLAHKAMQIFGATGLIACDDPPPLPKPTLSKKMAINAMNDKRDGARCLTPAETTIFFRMPDQLPPLINSDEAKIFHKGEIKGGDGQPVQRINTFLSACAKPNKLKLLERDGRWRVLKDEIFDARWYGDYSKGRMAKWLAFRSRVATRKAELHENRITFDDEAVRIIHEWNKFKASRKRTVQGFLRYGVAGEPESPSASSEPEMEEAEAIIVELV